jgi:uncharacterized Rmd1/YagE family protein
MLASMNSKLRRRNSHGGGQSLAAATLAPIPAAKMGPQRSTKNAQKLKLLPNPEVGEEGEDEESGRDVYSQYTRIKDPTARRDAARLGKADRNRLPRVTAYCTANKYQMEGLIRFLKGRGKSRGANPKLIDECIYTPYAYSSKQVETAQQGREEELGIRSSPVSAHERRHSTGEVGTTGFHREDLVDLDGSGRGFDQGQAFSDRVSNETGFARDDTLVDESAISDTTADFDIQVHTPEIFLFDYGVVVIWGMSIPQEQRLLKEIARFETEKLPPDDVETEYFNFYYTREYQARIYNDFITLRDKTNYMTKLAISHALAQSVKVGNLPLCPAASSDC